MKSTLLLCALLSALILSGCANQNTANNPSNASRRGLVGPGSVAPYSGGPAPGHIKQRYQP